MHAISASGEFGLHPPPLAGEGGGPKREKADSAEAVGGLTSLVMPASSSVDKSSSRKTCTC
jgi:hypothetical protein